MKMSYLKVFPVAVSTGALSLFLLGAEGGSCYTPPDSTTEDVSNGDECAAPADCEGQNHVLCEGAWQCVEGWCNWKCGADTCECTTADDCTGDPAVNCVGDWTCAEGVCQWKCSGVCVPTEEVCDQTDNDCDGMIDEGCETPVECVIDDDCEAGSICTDGFCVWNPVECSVDYDCPEGYFCDHGWCQSGTAPECSTGDDCGEGMECQDGVCVYVAPTCSVDEDCGDGWACVLGECLSARLPCSSDEDCPEFQYCSFLCGGGADAAEAPCAGECVEIECVASEEICDQIDNDCDGVVDEDCVIPVDCSVDDDCVQGLVCNDGICTASAADCSIDSDCAEGSFCDFSTVDSTQCCMPDQVCLMYLPACTGVCTPKADGECQTSADCVGGQYCRILCGNGWCAGDCIDLVGNACTKQKDCGEGMECAFPWACPMCVGCECFGECHKSGLAPLTEGQCWYDSDCLSGQTCVGEQICPIGAMCLLPDKPGVCK